MMELADEQLEDVVGGVKTPIAPNQLFRKQPPRHDRPLAILPRRRLKSRLG